MEEKARNLKGTYDKLTYSRLVNTGKTFPRQRSKKQDGGEFDVKIYHVPEQEKRVFSEEEIKNFSLDKHGKNIPYVDGEITIINNYLFDFWGYYLKAEGLALYAHLKRHAYGQKDWCFPSLELIAQKMDKSPNTIRNYLDILEHYGFVYKFNVTNADRDNLTEPSLYKIRKKVPLLTEKLINGDPDLAINEDAPAHIKQTLKKEQKGLPKSLKEDHNEYIERMLNTEETVDLLDSFTYEEIYTQLLKKAQVLKSHSLQKEIAKSKSISEKPHQDLKQEDIIVWQYVLNKMQGTISKPSYETWFKDTYCIKENDTYLIYLTNQFQKDWIESKYDATIKNAIDDIDSSSYHIKYCLIP